MPAPELICQLVQQFSDNQCEYRSARYNEAQLRHEFLDKFFEALGWDLYNKHGYPLDTRDVIVEDSLPIEGHSKSPDYAFKIGKERKFYVEAKKPNVDIKYDYDPAFQLRRYAWNQRLALSVLTDFEEFSLYDCREKPEPGVSPAAARLLYIRYDEYVERWDEIAAILSKEAVYKGAFDRYVADTRGKKGTTEVDDEFLKDIEEWRKKLALNLALRNPEIVNERQLNYAVQMTIDRIIFLRICEDRGIEPQEQLLELSKMTGIYERLLSLFRHADTRYNSGLFHFKPEKGENNPADSFTLKLRLDDRVLKEIIKGLYFPCPYIFKEIPVEILGQVYEQFLGKVIRLTPGHQAKVEEKPEVRKAGGVYYTPRYIVDYIVANTVGKLLEGKTPEEASQLKIVDPACGSGSFLLGAFQYLMDWHEDWYKAHDPESRAKGKAPALVLSGKGEWQLSTAEKKRILVNNIHGVDIDQQAVEVTKLSLLLKVLEEETGQLSLGFERVLPDLGDNIKCGNSLIGWDYFDGQLVRDEKEVERVNPFDWHSAFPQVFRQGGFDAVIGNPPYIRIQALQEWAPEQVKYYTEKYLSAGKGNYDIYVIFVERGQSILCKFGTLGFIMPNKFFTSQYGEPLRKIITNGNHIFKIIDFGSNQVFENATTYICLLFLKSTDNEILKYKKVTSIDDWRSDTEKNLCDFKANEFSSNNWIFSFGASKLIFDKLNSIQTRLGNCASRIYQGLKTGSDPVFILEINSQCQYFSKELNKPIGLESMYLKPLYKSGDFKRYDLHENSRVVIFPYIGGKLVSWKELSLNAPKTASYLIDCKRTLTQRENGKWSGKDWYGYSRNQALEIITSPKILTADINPFANYCFDENGTVFFPGGAAGGYGIILRELSTHYVLGLLNSKVVDFYHRQISNNFRGGWYAYDAKVIRNIPIYSVDYSNPNEVIQHDHIVTLVKHMLELHKRKPATPNEQQRLEREIAATDAQIDRLVYDLYDLTEDEIRIVEGI